MKRILIFVAIIASTLAIHAQVRVDSLSRLVLKAPPLPTIGEILPSPFSLSTEDTSDTTENITLDPNARMCILGNGFSKTGGYITFGPQDHVLVGSINISKQYYLPYLRLFGKTGIRFESKNGLVALYGSATNKFRFYTDVTVDGVFVNSDTRLKDNIEELDASYSGLSGISGYKYTLTRGTGAAARGNSRDNTNELQDAPSDGHLRYGFLAQEVKDIYPELVAEDEDGYLSVDYIGFIPLLVDAYNELSVKVKEQEGIIASLTRNKSAAPEIQISLKVKQPLLRTNLIRSQPRL